MQKNKYQIHIEFTEPLLGSASGNKKIHEDFIAGRAVSLGKKMDGDIVEEMKAMEARLRGKKPEDINFKSVRDEVAALLQHIDTMDISAEVRAEYKERVDRMREESEAIDHAIIQREQARRADGFDVEEEVEKTMTIFPRDETGLFVWDYQIRGFFKESLLWLVELGEPSVKTLNPWNYRRAVDNFLFANPRKIYLRNPAGTPWTSATDTLQRPLRAETMQGPRIALAGSEVVPPGTTLDLEIISITGANPKAKLAVIDKDVITQCFDQGELKGFGQWRTAGYGRFTWKFTTEE